jgi:hypothetical protein
VASSSFTFSCGTEKEKALVAAGTCGKAENENPEGAGARGLTSGVDAKEKPEALEVEVSGAPDTEDLVCVALVDGRVNERLGGAGVGLGFNAEELVPREEVEAIVANENAVAGWCICLVGDPKLDDANENPLPEPEAGEVVGEPNEKPALPADKAVLGDAPEKPVPGDAEVPEAV